MSHLRNSPDSFDVVQTEKGVTLAAPCVNCHTIISVTVPADALKDYLVGQVSFMQDAFPRLSAGEREFLISGVCEPCFDRMCDALEARADEGEWLCREE